MPFALSFGVKKMMGQTTNKLYTVINTLQGRAKVIKTGVCQNINFEAQAKTGEFVIEGKITEKTQKVVDGKIIAKTQQEIDDERSQPIDLNEMPANIVQKDWDALQSRLAALENRSI